MPYEVPALPYDYAALEPHIDEATMRVHHDKHHQAYVDKANGALEGTQYAGSPIEDVIRHLDELPEDKRGPVRNNGGGHINHTLFWESMSPEGGGEPDGELRSAIDAAFGSFEDFKAKIKETGVGSCTTARSCRWWAPRTRTTRSHRARRRCSASTCGSTPTT